MRIRYIHDGWTVKDSSLDGILPARVPGCLHTDLMEAGIVKDIFYRDNAAKYKWIENLCPVYETRFDAERGECVKLKFEGIDTFAEIYLNGSHIGSVHNMFIPHSFDVSRIIKEKDNCLRVEFMSPIKAVEGKPERHCAFSFGRVDARRIQCTYGWDWVYRFVTVGIYRPVYLEYREGLEVEDVYVRTDYVDRFGAQLTAEIDFSGIEHAEIAELEVISPDGKCVFKDRFYADKNTAYRVINISNPELWYPNGYGDQPLYTATVRTSVSERSVRFGIRTLRIQMLKDEKGSEYYLKAMEAAKTDVGKRYTDDDNFFGFCVIVNGIKIFAKGGNFVPCEPFASEESDDKLRILVKEAKEMGANILRVWGGGLFEKEAFYDACDECGLLIAHDFLMACATYPEDEEWFIRELLLESEYAVRMLRKHPSLAWFHGDNENASDGSDLLAEYTGRRSAYDGIYPNVLKLAPGVPFLTSSPWGGNRFGSITSGTSHNTNYLGNMFDHLDKSDFSDYKEFFAQFTSRFMSEEPTFGAICRNSMLKFMTESDLLSKNSEMPLFHTRTNIYLKRHLFDFCTEIAERVLGSFADAEDKYFKQKYIQCEWVRITIELALRNLGYTNGIIYWMYNDCWPAALGWSLIDYYTLRKAAYYAFKRASAGVVGSFSADGKIFTVTNTTDDSVAADTVIGAVSLTDKKKATENVIKRCLLLDPYSSVSIDVSEFTGEGALLVSDTSCEAETYRSFYKSGKLEITRDDGFEVIASDEVSVTLRANTYLQTVEFEGEYRFSDNYFVMLPGEIRRITFEKAHGAAKPFVVRAYTIK